jgi:WhiB family transcriptional regulator, redox-sensing transcriptional regulator
VLWADRAACKDMPLVLFFGEDGERRKVREFREEVAKQVCAGCPVKEDCLDFAMDRDRPEKYGVYGGLNEDERASERRRRQRRKNHDLAEAS